MIHTAVVRVFATTQSFDFEQPWQRERPSTGSGSGVVVARGRILTGAHVVADATFVQVQHDASPERFQARMLGVCHDSDLALLEVTERGFVDQTEPTELGGLPQLQDPIRVVGFPIGGEEVSITGGVVSRVEVQRYAHSQRKLLAVTVDAAINDGNSGGPVIDTSERVVGIAFQSLDDAENAGEMVPVPLIERFLKSLELGRPPGVPGLGIITQSLENPALRRALGLRGRTGVRVRAVDHGSSSAPTERSGGLLVDDVLLQVDGHPIAGNGTVRYRDRHRTTFDVLLGERAIGDVLPFRVFRAGHETDVEIELRAYEPLVPGYSFDQEPNWRVFGGVVFQELSRDYLRTWGERWWERAPKELLHIEESSIRTEWRQRVVVVTQVLADAINVGYGDYEEEVVMAVNGERPVDLRGMSRILDTAASEVVIETSSGARLVFDLEEAKAADASIRERYGVPRDRSSGLDAGSTGGT